ncbi:hypothetical protein [Umezawaea sp. Da 62-37]|uniref:hypothetical protein n=1 Tax=Umezawaea sp. Da 62-37 TaxID=3075927 RepID=UPI0028F70D0B|nr:hypothetical protein [Umezawaea sp. Da 62-37]WNV83092.1 hypothetical protein RM788_33550 [Umezawaea sp. Da 62-37]
MAIIKQHQESSVPTAPMELSDVVGYVLEHADDNDLAAIAQAMKSRRTILRMKAAAAVTVQTRVTIDGLSPTYLNGLCGVVTEIVNGRGEQLATVTLDKASTARLAVSSTRYGHLAGRDSHDLRGVPLSCCKVTSA